MALHNLSLTDPEIPTLKVDGLQENIKEKYMCSFLFVLQLLMASIGNRVCL